MMNKENRLICAYTAYFIYKYMILQKMKPEDKKLNFQTLKV